MSASCDSSMFARRRSKPGTRSRRTDLLIASSSRDLLESVDHVHVGALLEQALDHVRVARSGERCSACPLSLSPQIRVRLARLDEAASAVSRRRCTAAAIIFTGFSVSRGCAHILRTPDSDKCVSTTVCVPIRRNRLCRLSQLFVRDVAEAKRPSHAASELHADSSTHTRLRKDEACSSTAVEAAARSPSSMFLSLLSTLSRRCRSFRARPVRHRRPSVGESPSAQT